MYVITYEAVQDQDASNYDKTIGGAFIKFFLQIQNREQALQYALSKLKDYGWIPIELTVCDTFNPSDYAPDDMDYEYIQDALNNDESIIIHEWPFEQLE